MFKMAICDDNIVNLNDEKDLAIRCISGLTENYQCDTFLSGVELVEDVKELSTYDLIILDCDMEQLNGIETAEIIRKYSETVIIAFVTNYVDFALEGYSVDAARFVIKNANVFENQFNECIEYAYKKSLGRNRYITDFLEGTVKINLRDIVLIQSSNHYFYYYIHGCDINKPLIQRNKMDNVIKLMDDNMVHVHRNYIINMRYVVKISNQWVIMDCGGVNKHVPIRRGYEKKFEQMFFEYLGKIND